jgi:Tol biopolymer transport system component
VGGIVRVAPPLAVALVLAGLFAVAPSASADKILYVQGAERWWVIRPDGSHARRLPLFGTPQEPDLTLDGRRVVFVDLQTNALITSPLAHRRLRVVWRLPQGADPPVGPRWSPSGKRIAASRDVKPPSGWPEDLNFFQVFVIRPGAGRPRRLRTRASMANPSWSPNGRRIVAGSYRSETTCSGSPFVPPFVPVCETTFSTGLWVIKVATGAAREILHFDNESVGSPAWSPNGRTIAFERGTAQGVVTEDAHVWTVRPNGTGLRQLTPLLVGAQPPSWSPDGRRLAVTTTQKGARSDIATIRADGSGLRVLTRSGLNFYPDWSR